VLFEIEGFFLSELISARNVAILKGYAWCRYDATPRLTNDVAFYFWASRDPSKQHIIPSK